jgi:hypothetical protein
MLWDHISATMVFDATVISNHLSATTTYVMWREEHLWDGSVLQRVHFSNLSTKFGRALTSKG